MLTQHASTLTLSFARVSPPPFARIQPTCALPDWVTVTGTVAGGAATTAPDSASPLPSGFRCPTFGTAQSPYSSVSLDESYGARTACSCDANYFGRDGQCVRCPSGCSCSADRVQGCWPGLQRGSVTLGSGSDGGSDGGGSEGDADSDAHPGASIVPFRLLAMIPCARSESGAPLCNPAGVSWRHFYSLRDVSESADDGLAAVSASGAVSSAAALDLSDWCHPGHAGRLCAQCASGWFRNGRWCTRCMGTGAHALIVLAHLAVLLALVAALYTRTPTGMTARRQLQHYARLFYPQKTRDARLAAHAEDDAAAAVASVADPPSDSDRPAADAAPAASHRHAPGAAPSAAGPPAAEADSVTTAVAATDAAPSAAGPPAAGAGSGSAAAD